MLGPIKESVTFTPGRQPSHDYNDLMIRGLGILALTAVSLFAQEAAPFEVEEATIAQVHDAMKAGRLTCRALVERYLKRIDAYDKNGPAINSIVLVNPDALKQADETGPALRRGRAVTGRCTACR